MKAVIQCGGKGTRLRPYTSVLPKPLMPIGSRPVLELLLKWVRRNGIREVYITTGYLGHLIRSFCGDGRQWDLRIVYTQEIEPLGTIGPLDLLRDELDCTFLVLNGDVLTDLSLNDFSASHRNHGGLLTIATTTRETKTDYGLIEDHQNRVTQFREKPTLFHSVSMGAYCMEPEALRFVPGGVPFGFDDLVFAMMSEGTPVHAFRHHGLWLDIGRVEDFHRAQEIDWDEQAPSIQMTVDSIKA
ncbi:nucleotidyltransferase family protein [Belnapia sp. T6]|uniref:Nucleotidyltransferase family protein n=1 Tax=Belnapia mucosa TaxID=2804532 RepID=A0ABS1VBM3_9PROT|nr:nucleotidyltransferase family protein [Belnapia mucosa]MBL6459075.1 nucleotidyltransferase family protein [Belnapia mucosa]